MVSSLFGLTKFDVRKLVFQYCEMNGVRHRFNEILKVAGRKWMSGYMKRHPDISERNPEKLSLVCAYGFNRSNVLAFMRLLKSILFNANGDRLIPPNLRDAPFDFWGGGGGA